MKQKIIYSILAVLFVLVLVFSGLYYSHKMYFEGAVNTYVNAQRIPAKKISERKVSFNWTDDGLWEESMQVENYGQKLEYIYDMDWASKDVTLEIYKGQEGNVPKKDIEYPNLAYDK